MKLQTTIKLSALSLILALILSMPMFTLVSCGKTDDLPTDSQDTTEAPETTEAPTTETETETEALIGADVDPLLAKIAQKMADSESYLIFSIGDSLTEGQGASSIDFDYTAMFAKKLGEKFPEKNILRIDGKRNNDTQSVRYPSVPTQVQVIEGATSKITVVRSGFGGHTVKKITARSHDFINKKIKGETGDLFIICSGINDSAMGNKEKYAIPPKYKQQLSDLVDMIYAAHPEADVILMTPTYVGQDGSSLRMHVNAMKALAEERQIALIDLNKLWMDHWIKGSENYGQREWLKEGDSCHPTDIGHEAIADEMIRALFGVKPN